MRTAPGRDFAGDGMPDRVCPPPPRGLKAPGRALWGQLQEALPPTAEFDERDLAILALAARQADDVAALEREIRTEGVVVTGSQGQPRLNALVTEARQGRAAIAKLLTDLDLGEQEVERPRSPRSRRAQHAAEVRWAAVAERRERARGA